MVKVSLVNQMTDTGDESWSRYSCGICVIKMLMVFKRPELKNIPVKSLIDQALERNGYIENIGWKHQVLVDLAAFYGVAADFQKDFFDTREKKKEGIKFVNKILKSGLSRFSLSTKSKLENRGSSMPLASGPVAVSVLKEFNRPSTAHLVVVESVKKFGPLVWGYRIVDPYPGQRGNHYTVSRKEFLNGWRGGMIWLNEDF